MKPAIRKTALPPPETEREAAPPDPLAAARAIPDEMKRIQALGAAAILLPDAKREAAMREILAVAKTTSNHFLRAGIFTMVAPYARLADREAALQEVLAAARAIPDGSERGPALMSVAPFLREAERIAVLRETLAIATPDAVDYLITPDAVAQFRAVLAAYEPESKATVENSEETRRVAEEPSSVIIPPPHIGGQTEEILTDAISPDDATLQQAQTLLGEAIGKVGVAAVATMIVEAASPDDRARLIEGMAARGRELTGRDGAPVAEAATQEAKTEAQAFASALEAMTLKERRAALAEHYGLVPDKDGNYALPEEKKWANVRGTNPTPETFRAWLDDVFPDRREIGMVLSDLKHLDEAAHKKVQNWSGSDSRIPRATIESFGLPIKATKYDPVRDANAPKSLAEVITRAVRGEDTLKNLQRSYARAANHRASLG